MDSAFSGLTAGTRPAEDEVQVAVLGRGVGESIVVHIGEDRWIVVDSFNMRDGDGLVVPAALHYLDSIGVGMDRVVALVISHFDIDHVRGASRLFAETARDARLVLSGAMAAREFLAHLRLADRPGKGGDAGVRELRTLLALIDPPGTGGRVLERCRRDQSLLRNLQGGSLTPTTYGMAPCEDTITEFTAQVAPILAGNAPQTLPRPLLNRASAAIHLQVGDRAILLCGDLEHDDRIGSQDRGWGGALLPLHGNPATFVKLGHHGSQNGDHEDIWNRLTAADCVVAAAPYTAQVDSLPTEADIARIVSRGHTLYVAGATATPTETIESGTLGDLSRAGVKVSRRKERPGAVVGTCSAIGDDAWVVTEYGSTTAHR
ncbi:MBL fold metallo-hydrolase [Nocardioides sp. zg-1230]|uniref:MBL fold metallo-hydrolase n=1 Tax=Nocardioides sp. zg-1230 TaxID=2736601 RepID=UPI0015533C1F|nr:MBL fold metallo-hydrolase [Nocardioides sp. zg-1230]NPC42933.1 MBL fold metallo-hydrolase [Nocardioides sp. zg-1230]